jgi:hypothetical protein
MNTRLWSILAICACGFGCESIAPLATQMAEQYAASLQAPPPPPPPPEYAAGGYPPAGYTTEPPPPAPPPQSSPPPEASPPVATLPPAVRPALSRSASAIRGGPGGGAFSDLGDPFSDRVAEIRIRHGAWIDGVQVVMADAAGQPTPLAHHGGSGGGLSVFAFQPGEYVTGIFGRTGSYVDSITIQTNLRVSPKYGGDGGSSAYSLYVPPDHRFAGFHGRSGVYLDAVGLNFAKPAYPIMTAIPRPGLGIAQPGVVKPPAPPPHGVMVPPPPPTGVTVPPPPPTGVTVPPPRPPSGVAGLPLPPPPPGFPPPPPAPPLFVRTTAGALPMISIRGEEATRFDCATVTDEYEQLMFGDVLANPGMFVETLGGRISRDQFDASQRGRLRLAAAHRDHGVGLLETSTGARAKFLFAWSDAADGAPLLEVVDATVYTGDTAGTSKRHGVIRLGPGSAIDLDFPAAGSAPVEIGDAFDVGYRIAADGQLVIESLGSAKVAFPTQSLCGETERAGEAPGGA